MRGSLTAYNLKDGSLAWRGYSMGPDADTLIDPEKTTHLGKPVGKDSGTNTWEGDQWKIGGGTTWGWYSRSRASNLVYYGTGNPSTWNPKQRPGDNRWSMTIFARDADTGVAKWVYQMTPHDEWDYDGVNEMILVDIPVKGKDSARCSSTSTATASATRWTGPRASCWWPRSTIRPSTGRRMSTWTTGRPQVVPQYSTDQNGEDVNTKNICPAALGTKDQQPAAFSPKTGLFYVPTNHVCMDYEPFQVSYTAGQPYVGATLVDVPGRRAATHLGNFIAWDAARVRSSGRTPSRSRSGPVRWRPPATSSSTARSKAT